MKAQTFENHSTIYAPKTFSQIGYYVCVISLNTLAVANLYRAMILSNGRISAVLFVLTALSLTAAYFLFRSYTLKVQDRVIRAEENLRHYILTGKLLDKKLTLKQIIALRFASDEEFLALTERALKENLSSREIKKAVKNWKADYHRA